MITLEQAKSLQYGDHIYFISCNKNGLYVTKVKVNGKPQTWKRLPERVRIPAKHGLSECFQIWEDELNLWFMTENDALKAIRKAHKLGVYGGGIQTS